MLELIITVFAVYGLAFLLKESDGPFGIIAKMRNALFLNKHVGVFFHDLFSCYFCLGCHCGWIVYLLSAESYKIQFFVLWTLAGGVISLIFDGLMTKLHSSSS